MASTTAANAEALLLRPSPAEEPSGAAGSGLAAGVLSGSDGADDPKDYGTLPPPSRRDTSAMPVTWEDWSHPWWLLLQTGTEVGSILFALLCMLFMVWMKDQFCMNCGMDGLELWETCLCEYTKSYVRLFPLIALVVALAVASRALLRRHFFYQMLKHRVVVRLQSKRPLQDWLFWVLIACLLHVLCHFILDKAIRTRDGRGLVPEEAEQYKRQLTEGQFMHLKNSFNRFVKISITDAKMFNLYYCAPAICFMAFLWTSYDVEQTLLPLSKFMEGDAEQARDRLTSTSVIDEGDAHRAVKTGLPIKGDDDGYQLQDLCRRLAEHAERLEQDRQAHHAETRCPACGAVLLEGGGECAKCAGRAGTPAGAALVERKPHAERVDFTKSWWIAELMIDRQLVDDESRSFRHVWYIYSVVSLLVTAVVASCFMYSMYSHVKEGGEAWSRWESEGHRGVPPRRDFDGLCVRRLFCACVAELLHLGVAVHVGADFVLQEWHPLREAAEHKAEKHKAQRAAKKARAAAALGASNA